LIFPITILFAQDWDNIFQASREKNIDIIITTEKDAARLSQLTGCRLPIARICLRIELIITKMRKIDNRLRKLYPA